MHPNVGEVRHIGFLVGLEMVKDKETKESLSDEDLAGILAFCKDKGLIIGRNGDTVPGQNNVIIVAPPLVSTEEDLRFIVDTVKAAIKYIFNYKLGGVCLWLLRT